MIRGIHNFFLVDIAKLPCLGNKQKSQVCLCQFPQSIRRPPYSPVKKEDKKCQHSKMSSIFQHMFIHHTYPSNTSSFFSWSFRILSSIVFSMTNLTILCMEKKSVHEERTNLHVFRQIFQLLLSNWIALEQEIEPYRFILPYSVNSVLSLALHGRVPPRVHKEYLTMPRKQGHN